VIAMMLDQGLRDEAIDDLIVDREWAHALRLLEEAAAADAPSQAALIAVLQARYAETSSKRESSGAPPEHAASPTTRAAREPARGDTAALLRLAASGLNLADGPAETGAALAAGNPLTAMMAVT